MSEKLGLVRSLQHTHFRRVRGILEGQTSSARFISPVVHVVVGKIEHSRNEVRKNSINIQKDTLINKKVSFDSTKDSNLITKKTKKKETRLRGLILTALFIFFTALSILMLSVLLAPSLYYTFFPDNIVPIKANTLGTPLGGSFTQEPKHASSSAYLPPYDESLPDGNWLIIPKIGVRTEILESQKPEDSLNKGVWRVPDFGVPSDQSKPIILAAHRYGWKSWWDKSEYWKYHSFYLLPDLKPGDLVEIIWQKRRYVYEIYAGEEGEEIRDYQADLIMYTCKFLDSPVRHFRYARLIDLQKDTQVPSNGEVPPDQASSSSKLMGQSTASNSAQVAP